MASSKDSASRTLGEIPKFIVRVLIKISFILPTPVAKSKNCTFAPELKVGGSGLPKLSLVNLLNSNSGFTNNFNLVAKLNLGIGPP